MGPPLGIDWGDPWTFLSVAGTLGFILCLLPQLVKTARTGRADDLSWGFLVLVLFSSACTLPYMVHAGEPVFAVSQAVNLLVWGIVLAYKIRGAQKSRVGQA